MSEIELFKSLASLITIAIAFVFFYWVWRQYAIDVMRQQLFELRDQLFDLATEGKLHREGDTYKTLRKIFNANVRFAHEMDWVHMFVFYLMAIMKRKGAIFRNAMHVAHLVTSIEDAKTRSEVQKLMLKMHLVVAWHVYRTSLVLLLFTPIVFILAAFFTLSAKLLYRTPRKVETLINARAYSLL